MADLNARLDGLSPAKRKLLLERLRQGAARREAEEGTGEIPRVPRDVGGELPLSFGQQQLWRIEQLAPGSPVYNVPLAASLEGDLDPAALAGALTGVLTRHEVLRTRFEAAGPDARPVLEATASLPLPQADISGLPEVFRHREAARLGAEETLRPFDLGCAPLLRALLLRLAPRSWTLHLTLHHIASDGWSVGVLLQDLAVFYAGRAPELPPLPVQYADFAAFQRQRLSGDRLEGLVAWWRERLMPPPPPLSLPLDRPRPPVPSAAGGQRVRVLPRELAGRLARLSDSQGTTLFITLLAGLQAQLRRYTGQEDLAVGTPVAGRDRPELEGLIGYFVNTLVLRTSLGGDPSFRELLARSRETALGAWAHAELPFELLVERLRPERDPALTPFFQVLLTLQNAPVPRLDLPGLTLAPLPAEADDEAAAKFDIALTLSEEKGVLVAVASYRRDLFEGTTIQRFLSGFETLLTAAATDPDRSLSRLPVMSEGECHQLLHEWNDSAAPVPERSIYELFEEHAATHPEDIAVEAGPVTLTYGELSRRCRRLAVRLRAHGVGPEVPVGLLMESSWEAVLAALGVLAAGGAFVPLDPLQPAERIAGLLEETGAPVVLAVEELLARVPEGSWRVLGVEGKEEKDDKDSRDGKDGLPRRVHPQQAAYILYTSGSTGKPKGTVVSHRSLTNYLLWAGQALPGPIALLSRLIFDACLKQLLAPFVIGSRVWVPVAKPVTAPRELMAELAARPGATINCAPSIWRALLESVEAGAPARLAHLLLGGEIVDPALLARTRKAIPGIEIHNVYGPTETTVSSTEGTILDHEPIIGRPVANNQVHLLGPYLEPLPPGAVGELYIGGIGLARGYLGRPGLTAERFLPDPFSEIPGERMYRTGDRVRQKPDGNLIVLGRFDDQIKIRGVRIEPGEVEAALASHPAVLRAAVLGIEDAPGAGRLVAFAVLATGAAETPEDLRAFLEARLPPALVPSSFQILDSFPLTATGKTDRRALARQAAGRPASAPYRPPLTPTEVRLTEIWREILGAERIGVDDSFFELGGDSVLALRLALQARESGLPLDAARLFLHPTIARLAADLDVAGAAPSEAPIVAAVPTTGPGRRDLDRLRRKLS